MQFRSDVYLELAVGQETGLCHGGHFKAKSCPRGEWGHQGIGVPLQSKDIGSYRWRNHGNRCDAAGQLALEHLWFRLEILGIVRVTANNSEWQR